MAARRGAGRLVRLGGAVAALAVAATGCGGPDMTAEQWTDQMCGAVLPFVRTVTTPPPPTPDLAARTREISGYLGRATEALDVTLGTLQQLGPAPVEDGERVSTGLQDSLKGIRTAFATSRTRVDALDTSNPAALQRTLPEALAPVSRLQDASGPVAGVTSNPELSAAARGSANCQALNQVSQAARNASGAPAAPGGEGGGN